MISANFRRLALTFILCSSASFAGAQAGSGADQLWAANDWGLLQDLPVRTPNERVYPIGLMALPEATRFLLWIELQQGRLNILEQLSEKSFRILKSIPISIGKHGYGKEVEGDKRTPVGIYRITSHIPDEDLTEFYGLGAFPINYPNVWDRLQYRSGSGIWLHGLSKGVESRPLLDSDGCVVVDNTSLQYLDELITPGSTLVVLANSLEWRSQDSSIDDATPLLNAFQEWQEDWESLDAGRYLSNYHPKFYDFKRNLEKWSTYKRRVNGGKSFINVTVSELTAIRYPSEKGLVSVRFYQDYKSSNYHWAGWKQQLWQKDSNGQWKIFSRATVNTTWAIADIFFWLSGWGFY